MEAGIITQFLLVSLFSGIFATTAMVMFLSAVHRSGFANSDMIRALGSLMTGSMSSALKVGTLLHFFAGFTFALLYNLAFTYIGLEGPLLILLGTALGFGHGFIVSFLLVTSVAESHPLPQFREAGPAVGLAHLGAHVVYGGVIGLSVALTTMEMTKAYAVPKDGGKSVYDYEVNAIDGQKVNLKDYAGKVTLLVNTASNCGYTSQYADLEEIYDKYRERGFSILAFPSNDFGGQEPGANNEIKAFCESKFNVSFPLFEKGPVKGDTSQPLFSYLTENAPEAGEIRWNFEKFLVNGEGQVVKRFRSSVRPNDPEITEEIEGLLTTVSS